MDVDQTGHSLEAIERTYRSLGVAALRSFYSPSEMACLKEEADGLLAKYETGEVDSRRIAYRPTIDGGRIFERFDPVCDIAPQCEAISRDPRLLELAKPIIGGEPFLLKDKLLYKLDSDKGYELHQDYPYYYLTEPLKQRVVTIAIAIDDISEAGGGLTFVLGCHDKIQPAPVNEPNDVDPDAVSAAPKWKAHLPAGSVILFHALTPHCSGANNSGTARRMLYLTYIDKRASDLREKYYKAREADLYGDDRAGAGEL